MLFVRRILIPFFVFIGCTITEFRNSLRVLQSATAVNGSSRYSMEIICSVGCYFIMNSSMTILSKQKTCKRRSAFFSKPAARGFNPFHRYERIMKSKWPSAPCRRCRLTIWRYRNRQHDFRTGRKTCMRVPRLLFLEELAGTAFRIIFEKTMV